MAIAFLFYIGAMISYIYSRRQKLVERTVLGQTFGKLDRGSWKAHYFPFIRLTHKCIVAAIVVFGYWHPETVIATIILLNFGMLIANRVLAP